MSQIHNIIISYIREQDESFASLTDEQMMQRMFYNYRDGQGLRLSQSGAETMCQYFKIYEIKVPDNEETKALHLMFLDSNARMPYYCGKHEIVVYDHVLGVKLRLVDGRLSSLMNIE